MKFRRPALFNPMVWWELVRLARRGHVFRVRVLLLYALLLAVIGYAAVWSYPVGLAQVFDTSPDPIPPDELARLAHQLALVLFEAQLLLVAVVTPAYAAAAVAEEKDRYTLPLLLTTDLTDQEIVWGKAMARVLLVLAAVVAGVPVLMLPLLFGGVDPGFVVAGYALTAGTVVLSVAVGVSAGSRSPDARTALVRAYTLAAVLVGALLVPPFVLFSPFAMLAYLQQDFTTGGLRLAIGFGYPVGQVLIAGVLMIEATQNLRRAGPTAGPPHPTAFPEPPRGRPVPVLRAPTILPVLPPVNDADPILWKERHIGVPTSFGTPVRWLGALLTVVAVALFVTGSWGMIQRTFRALDPDAGGNLARFGPGPPDQAGAALVAAGTLAGSLCLVPLAVGLAGCIAGERQRSTLDSLLATTLSRRWLLWSKARVHIERGLAHASGAVAGLGAGFAVDGGWWFGLAAASTFICGFGLVVGAGTWASVRGLSPGQAFRLCLPAVVLVIALPVIVWNFTDWNAVAHSTRLLAYAAAGFALVGGLCFWRAGAELSRGS